MNIEKYNTGIDDLYVIMQTVKNPGKYEKSGNDTNHYSFLNKRGFFEKIGTPEQQILTWNDRQSAESAATIVREKKSPSVRALTINESGRYLGENFIEFCDHHEAALTSYLNYKPFKDAESRRINEEKVCKKIFFHASKILEVADAETDEARAMMENKINSQNPGWSTSSSARSLLGKKSMDVIERIRLGEIQTSAELTGERLEQAITTANKLIANGNHNF